MSSIFVFIQALVDLVTNLINIEIAILCELFLKITSNLLNLANTGLYFFSENIIPDGLISQNSNTKSCVCFNNQLFVYFKFIVNMSGV